MKSTRPHASLMIAAILTYLLSAGALANAPTHDSTAKAAIKYLKYIGDHQYATLRMTELAAGTDFQRQGELDANAGTAPTPNTAPTKAKASHAEVRSLARRMNQTQRENILTAQRLLRDVYGVTYQPKLRNAGREMIAKLEQAPVNAEFDTLYLRQISLHTQVAVGVSLDCVSVALFPELCRRFVYEGTITVETAIDLHCRINPLGCRFWGLPVTARLPLDENESDDPPASK